MSGTILLLGFGYLAMGLLAAFVFGYFWPTATGDDISWHAAGSIFWPLTIALFLILLAVLGPVMLGIHLYEAGRDFGRRRIQKRRDE